VKKNILERFKGKEVKLVLKPSNFALNGFIDEVFDDCIEFRTVQKTSYIDFELIQAITPFLRYKKED